MEVDFIPGRKKGLISAVIIDSERDYCEDIENFFLEKSSVISISGSFSEWDEGIGFARKNHATVLIVNSNYIEQLNMLSEQELSDIQILIAVENLGNLDSIQRKYPHYSIVYKYSPMMIYTQKILALSSIISKDANTAVVQSQATGATAKIVAFYSPKGGVGKTTIAYQTALHLGNKQQRVLLIDFATFGNIGLMSGLNQKQKGLSDILDFLNDGSKSIEDLKEMISTSVQQLEVSGAKIDVLYAASPIKMSALTVEGTDLFLEALSSLSYDAILVDTSSEISERNVSLLSQADDVCIISNLDITSCSAILSVLELMNSLNHKTQYRYLILNKFRSSAGFPVNQFESLLGLKTKVVIPDYGDQLQGFVNLGVQLLDKPFLKAHRYMKQVGQIILPVFSDKEQGKGKRLFKRGV